MTQFNTGDRVAMRASWLRNTGQFTGPAAPTSVGPFARGTVETVAPLGQQQLVSVLWDDGETSRVLGSNLALADKPNLRLCDPGFEG